MSTQVAAVLIVALICIAVVLCRWIGEQYDHLSYARETWKIKILEARIAILEGRAVNSTAEA